MNKFIPVCTKPLELYAATSRDKTRECWFLLNVEVISIHVAEIPEIEDSKHFIHVDLLHLYNMVNGQIKSGLEEKVRWELELIDDHLGKRARFEDLVLPYELRSFGIGSLMLQQLILTAQSLDADLPLMADLSQVDSIKDDGSVDIENIERRHKLYEKFGFVIKYHNEASRESGSIHTNSVLNLVADFPLNNIEKRSIKDELISNRMEVNEIRLLLKKERDSNKSLWGMYKDSNQKEHKYFVLSILLGFTSLSLLCICLYFVDLTELLF